MTSAKSHFAKLMSVKGQTSVDTFSQTAWSLHVGIRWHGENQGRT